jgi:hypothetical protein
MTTPPQNLTIYPDYCHNLSPTIGIWCPLRATDIHALRKVGMFCDGMPSPFQFNSIQFDSKLHKDKRLISLMRIEKPLFHYQNHPVKWVRVTGVIVAVDEYLGRNVYTVDDSSGILVECVCVAPAPAPKMETIGVPRHLDQIASINRDATTFATETKKDAGSGKRDGENKGKAGEKIQPSVQEPNVPWAEMDVGAVVKVKGRVGEFREQKQVEVVKVEVLRCTDEEVRCWNEVMDFRRNVLGKAWVVPKEQEEKCRRVRERELRGMGKGEKVEKRKEERGEAKRKRTEMERKKEDFGRRKEREGILKASNKANNPSLAARRTAAGKI